LTCDGDEVGHEVKRERQVADEQEQKQLAATWNSGLSDEPRNEHDAVGDERRERPCVLPPADDHEPADERRVQGKRQPEREQDPRPPLHTASVRDTSEEYAADRGKSATVRRFLVVLALIAALAAFAASDAGAIRFADTPCPEAGPGGARICPAGVVGEPYAITLAGAGGCGPALPYAFTLLSGALPPGLSLQSKGVLSGRPSEAGSWSFWLQLSDENPPSASWCIPKTSQREFAVRVDPPRTSVGASYSVTLGAEGDAPLSWSVVSGALPPGITLNSVSGVLDGRARLPGSFAFTLSATDSKGRTTPVELGLSVAPRLDLVTTRLRATRVGYSYAARIKTTGGVRPATLKILSGTLPIGLRLNQRTGVLSGRPRTAGVYRIKMGARDAVGATASRILSLKVVRTTSRT
jgi:hypothetical protein